MEEELDLTGPVCCALNEMQAYIQLTRENLIFDKWKINCQLPGITAAHLSDIGERKQHFQMCLKQTFSSAAIILMRSYRVLKRRSLQLNSDLSSTDEPQFSKCLNPDDPQML